MRINPQRSGLSAGFVRRLVHVRRWLFRQRHFADLPDRQRRTRGVKLERIGDIVARAGREPGRAD